MRSNENPITTPVLLKLSHGSCWWNPNCVPWSGHLPIPMMYSFVSLVVSNHMWDDDRQWPIFIFQWVEANNQFIELLLTLAAVFLDENLRVIRFVLPFQDLRFVNKGTVLSYLIIISFIENTLQQHGIYHDMIYHDIYIYITSFWATPFPNWSHNSCPFWSLMGRRYWTFGFTPFSILVPDLCLPTNQAPQNLRPYHFHHVWK